MDDTSWSRGLAHDDPAPSRALTPPHPRVRRAGGRLTVLMRAARVAWLNVTFAVIVAVLLAPPAFFFATGAWALVTYVQTLWSLGQLLQQYRLAEAYARLTMLGDAAGLGLVSAGFYAVLFSTMVLIAGLLARGWRRSLLLMGLSLTIPSVVLFGLGARLASASFGARSGLSIELQSALMLYAVIDALLLAALFVDLRPDFRRGRRRRAQARTHGGVSGYAAPGARHATPAVRFGPAVTSVPPAVNAGEVSSSVDDAPGSSVPGASDESSTLPPEPAADPDQNAVSPADAPTGVTPAA